MTPDSHPSLEAGIRALGRVKLADLYPNESDPVTRASFIEAEVQMTYRKDLSNLARCKRPASKVPKQFRRHVDRRQDARQLPERRSHLCPLPLWFDFSLAELEDYMHLEEFKRNMICHFKSLSPSDYDKAFTRFAGEKVKKIAV